VLIDPSMVPVLSRTADAAGHPGLAHRVICFAEDLAADHGDPSDLVALTSQAKGNLASDAGPVVEAARLMASSPRRLAAAQAYEDAAVLLDRDGDGASAVRLAKEALLAYHECAASSAARRVRHWLRARGVNLIPGQRRGRPSFGWDALSDAEARVVELVAEGLTNRQIGERLYLSRYTVDTHLRHVFAKLGLASRVSLTRAFADRHGRIAQPA